MTARLDPIIERYRFAHHTVAMMFAMGLTVVEIARRTGFTQRRLRILLDDPTFCELIEHYRLEHIEQLKQALPDAMMMMEGCRAASVRQISEQLEAADEEGAEPIPLAILVKIHGDMADRTGYSKHSIKTVVNVDFASALERASQRSDSVREVKLIEGEILPPVVSHARPTADVVPLPRTYRRA